MIGRVLAFLTAERSGLEDAALRHGGASFRALAEMEAAAVFLFDEDRLHYANPALQALTGLSAAELAGLRFWELAAPDFQSTLRERGRACLRGESAQSRCEVRLAGESGRWMDVTLCALATAGEPMSMALAIDITDRKLSDQAHREAERRLKDILENAPDAALFLDESAEVTFCNEHLLALLECTEEEVVGQNWFDRFVPEDQREIERSLFRGNMAVAVEPSRHEGHVVTRSGARRRISWSSTPLRDNAGRIVGAAHLGADRTERAVAGEARATGLLDVLTGLPNRTLLMDRIAGCMARAQRRPAYGFAVLIVDVDRFKMVNDSLGRPLGDKLLVEIGERLSCCLRPSDSLAHLGGDEFGILIDELEQSDVPSRVADRVQGALSVPFPLGGEEVFISASIGIATHRPRYRGPEDILRDADIAMHHAKSEGKARQREFNTAMHARTVGRLQIENDLHRALDRGELRLHYQPILSLRTDTIAGFEALLRWERPQHGRLAPADFLQIAEESGLIVPIGSWVLQEACRQARSWQKDLPGGTGLTMSVNVSARQLGEPDLVANFERIVHQSGVTAGTVKLEITESALMEKPELAARMLGELRAGGIDSSIDDFGTGYSSLSYLLRLPAQTLKIDRSFVHDMANGQRAEMVHAIVGLAHSLKMDVIGEGVETEPQLAGLRLLDCDYVQGYLISPPVDAAGAFELVARDRRG